MRLLILITALIGGCHTVFAGTVLVCHENGQCEIVITVGDTNG